jgi:beta-lactamase superfamily II metal-dependent hydrolase
MLVCSEMSNKAKYFRIVCFNSYLPFLADRNKEGCLFCGDSDFKKYDVMAILKKRLQNSNKNIGLLQIPHHGSRRNFKKNLYDWLIIPFVSFACCGKRNRYRHPSRLVVRSVRVYGLFIKVTEMIGNQLEETINVYRK